MKSACKHIPQVLIGFIVLVVLTFQLKAQSESRVTQKSLTGLNQTAQSQNLPINLRKQQQTLPRLQDIHSKIIAERRIGIYYCDLGQADSAKFYLTNSLKNAEQVNDKREQALTHIAFRILYLEIKDIVIAMQHAITTQSIYEQLKDSAGIARAKTGIAEVHYFQENGDYEYATRLAQEAYDYQKRHSPDSEDLARTCRSLGDLKLGLVYMSDKKISNYKKIIPIQEEGLRIRRKIGDSVNIARALVGFGNALKFSGRTDETLEVYKEGYEICKQINYLIRELSFAVNLNGLYNSKGLYKKSLALGLEVHDQLLRSNFSMNLSDNTQGIAYAYRGLGNADSCFFYMQKAILLRDSMLSAENNKALAEMQIRFETTKKETQIEEQASTLAKQRWRLGFSLLGLFVALSVGIWLFSLTKKLRKRNEEKEYLLKEIHHRVKNNLTVISSLLEMQSMNVDDANAKAAIAEGQSRVRSIGLIHQQLYQHDDLAKIDLQLFIRDLYRQIASVFQQPGQQIQQTSSIPKLSLDVDTAVPLGLIINELLTNSFKYAFQGRSEGRIDIKIQAADDHNYIFTYSDDGPGLPSGYDFTKSKSMGLRLIKRLATQISGHADYVHSEDGSKFVIHFKNHAL